MYALYVVAVLAVSVVVCSFIRLELWLRRRLPKSKSTVKERTELARQRWECLRKVQRGINARD